MSAGIHTYFIRLFFICAASIFCEIISENTKAGKSSVGTALKLVCSLCICITVFSFFRTDDLLSGLQGMLDAVEKAGSAAAFAPDETLLLEKTRMQLEKQIDTDIFENCGIKPTDVSIQFTIRQTVSGTDVGVASLSILLPDGTPPSLQSAVSTHTQNLLGCTATVSNSKSTGTSE